MPNNPAVGGGRGRGSKTIDDEDGDEVTEKLPTPVGRSFDQAISDCLAGSFLGGATGAMLLTTYLAGGGTNGAVNDGTPVAALYAVYILSLGVAGGVGGILRPRLSTLRGQLIFCFVATSGLYGGQMLLADAFSLAFALGVALAATGVWVIVGRATGVFKEFSGEPTSGHDGL